MLKNQDAEYLNDIKGKEFYIHSADDMNIVWNSEDKIGLDFKNYLITQLFMIKNASDNFNEEFLENYDNFSPSWRRDADRMIKKDKTH